MYYGSVLHKKTLAFFLILFVLLMVCGVYAIGSKSKQPAIQSGAPEQAVALSSAQTAFDKDCPGPLAAVIKSISEVRGGAICLPH